MTVENQSTACTSDLVIYSDTALVISLRIIFRDFPGLENGLTKFHEFPYRGTP